MGKCYIFKISFYGSIYIIEYYFTTSHEVLYVARLTECENAIGKMKKLAIYISIYIKVIKSIKLKPTYQYNDKIILLF